MPSEKLRYLVNRNDPKPPIDLQELRKNLSSFDSEHLMDILWVRAQEDVLLSKILIVSAVLHSSAGDTERAEAAIDYALYFPGHVRYSESGHGQILDEIKRSIQYQAERGYSEFAICVGEYAIELAEKISENFEDDWEWVCSLDDLVKCVDKARERSRI